MSARAIVVVLACVAAIAAAQCPTSTLTTYYQDSTCSTSVSAMSTWCSCVGLTYSTATNACVGTSSSSCAAFATCGATFFSGLNAAAAAGSTCTGLSALKTPLTLFALGTSNYTGSAVQTACQTVACNTFNSSSTSTCLSSISSYYMTMCYNPYSTLYNLIISTPSGFTCAVSVFATYSSALATDLSNYFGFTATIITVTCGSIGTSFTLPVSSNTPGLASLVALAANIKFNALAAVTGLSASSFGVTSLGVAPTPAPGGFALSSGRASWTAVSVIAAALALAF